MIRSWVKLWINEWLDGTTRYEMSGAQRAFWIDLLALAGRSRSPGIICAGRDGERFIGYPLKVFSALDAGEEIDVVATFELFERTGKITVEVTAESPTKLYKISICSWDRYQSEYLRQKSYRQGHKPKTKSVTTEVTADSSPKLQGEGEGETTKPCANSNGSHKSNSSSHPEPEIDKAVRRLWDYYLQQLEKNPKLLSFTPARKRKGQARLEECLAKTGGDLSKAEGLMRLAVDALAASRFHQGENEQGRRYDSWEKNLFASPEQLERWLEQA